jgi:hypothetical protein
MPRMFRVLGFLCLLIALLSLAYGLVEMSLLFFVQAAVFVLLGYMNLTEKAYILTFWAYLVVATIGLTYGAFFLT